MKKRELKNKYIFDKQTFELFKFGERRVQDLDNRKFSGWWGATSKNRYRVVFIYPMKVQEFLDVTDRIRNCLEIINRLNELRKSGDVEARDMAKSMINATVKEWEYFKLLKIYTKIILKGRALKLSPSK